MNRPFFVGLIIGLTSICSAAIAQSYEFRDGYIFNQAYVKRVSLDQAEKIANIPGLFGPLMTFDWTQQKEEIKDKRVKRLGKRLVLEFGGDARLSLKNFSTKKGDGELQLFRYIKSIPGYHIVGVEYGHDQPQFMLIAESGSPVYFVGTN
ncbi:MAG: hypothetical protein HEQ39_05910 [Rhizobacter sp.]